MSPNRLPVPSIRIRICICTSAYICLLLGASAHIGHMKSRAFTSAHLSHPLAPTDTIGIE